MVEGWVDQHLNPRARSLVIAGFKATSMPLLLDMFTGKEDTDYMGLRHRLKMCTAVNNCNVGVTLKLLEDMGIPKAAHLALITKMGQKWLEWCVDMVDKGMMMSEVPPEESSSRRVLMRRPFVLKTSITDHT
jgi:hypothetical protein